MSDEKLTIEKPAKGIMFFGVAAQSAKGTSHNVNCSKFEKRFVDRAAASLGISTSSFVRQVVLSAAEEVLQERISDAVRRQTKRGSEPVRGTSAQNSGRNRTSRKRKDNNHEDGTGGSGK